MGPIASLDAAFRSGVEATLRRIDLTWPDLTLLPKLRLETLLRDVEGLALAGDRNHHAGLALAASDLQASIQRMLHGSAAVTNTQQLEVVDALVRIRVEMGLGGAEPFLAPIPKVCVLTGDADIELPSAEALAAGYLLEFHHDPDALLCSVREEVPDLVVLDLEAPFLSGILNTFSASLQEGQPRPLPIAFLSQYGDLQARLEAVRASGAAFFTKPLDLLALLDSVDRLTQHQRQEPIRALIVEDDALTAAFCTRILEGAGMQASVVRDPMAVMQPLVEHRPDVLIMDLYMPGCSGLELAAVIRQQEAHVGLPILFLSSETELELQLEALSLGAEDFLTKPIAPRHLISIVTTRAFRGRQFRNLMVRDGLTGLLNQVRFKEELRQELTRASRVERPLSFAMLDLDHFKEVNDTYGHMSGDRVIKNLARVLQRRLRKTDVIGRWGGEEFAVILPDTELALAQRVMEDIRERFAELPQELGRKLGRASFSCGLAAYPAFGEFHSLVEAADQALYAAKRAGRNRTLATH